LTTHRLYFSHSYDLDDLRFNEHLWKLLMRVGFHAWIDTGRDLAAERVVGLPGARRPMDVSFNEWMMSQCDGFVAIAPKRRNSAYQMLEYRTAIRMGVPRLVALQLGGNFNARDPEVVFFGSSWNQFWQDETQSKLIGRIEEFARLVARHKTAGEILQSAGRWQSRHERVRLRIALLAPHASDPEWQEMQDTLQNETEIFWELLSPANIQAERELLDKDFDLLVVDVGPHGTPDEALGYIHAIGIPQIRLCRVFNGDEALDLSRFLEPTRGQRPRSVYEQDPANQAGRESIPRFLDGFKLDSNMRPVIFWMTPRVAAQGILETTQRILAFRSGLSPEEGGIAEAIDTHQSAKKYFDQYWSRAGRGSVFISFAGSGGASKLADSLVQILRFQNLRCFHYRDRDPGSDGRLESGEDVIKGLKIRVNQADIVVYLIEDKFLASEYCNGELQQGLNLRDRGLIEFRAYSIGSFAAALEQTNAYMFGEVDWNHTDVQQRIVADVEKSVETLGWTLRKEHRSVLANWLKDDHRDSPEAVARLLRDMGVPDPEVESFVSGLTGDSWLDAALRLPKERDNQKRTRQLVALLLFAVTQGKPERRETAAYWLSERRLLQWPALVRETEHSIYVDSTFLEPAHDLTIEEIKTTGQKIGQSYATAISSGEAGPLCVTARTNFLAMPIEWMCESQADEPLAVRQPVRWRLLDANCRPSIFDSVGAQSVPPTALILALDGRDIKPSEQKRHLHQLLRSRYDALHWPPELVASVECHSVDEVLSRLRNCEEQILHIAGHMGGAGLEVGGKLVPAIDLAAALHGSDVRLVVLNGCEAGKPTSPLATAYLTLADRLIRDAQIPEVVAHRCKITEDDALAFAEAFHTAFLSSKQGFDPARAAVQGRKAGSNLLRYSPVVISQRELVSG
jgi:hypothetical protein